MDQRTRRSPARFLGPLALIVVLVAALAIVTGNGSTDNGSNRASDTGAQTSTNSGSKSKTTAKSTHTGPASVKAATRKSYTIKVGDTLGGIADREGVTVEQLQELNPDADPHNLIAGQKIRLR